MRKICRLLTILMICFLMLAPVAVMAQDGDTTTQAEEAPLATNWGPLVFMGGFAIVVLTGLMVYSNYSSKDTANE